MYNNQRFKYVKISCVSPLPYFKQSEWFFEEINGNKQLTQVLIMEPENLKDMKNCEVKI